MTYEELYQEVCKLWVAECEAGPCGDGAPSREGDTVVLQGYSDELYNYPSFVFATDPKGVRVTVYDDSTVKPTLFEAYNWACEHCPS